MPNFMKNNAVTTLGVDDGAVYVTVGSDDSDDAFIEAATAYCAPAGSECVLLDIRFRVADILDDELLGHHTPGDPKNLVSIDCKPTLDALEKTLEQMLARLKAIQYRYE